MSQLWKSYRAGFQRLLGLFRKPQRDAELAAELDSHLQLHIEDNLRVGMTPEAARRDALIKLGGLEQTKENYRERRGLPALENLLQDLRFALRVLLENPGFSAVAVLTLALGIGANTALFSVVNGVLLNPLPYPQPGQLVSLYEKEPDAQEISVTYLNFLDWRKDTTTFASMASYRHDDFNLTGADKPERLRGEMVSAGLFPLLGVKPVIGRVFTSEDDRPGASPVVLVGAGFWARKFASAPQILGKAITLNGTDYAVVGIIPASFRFDGSNDVYIPIAQWSYPEFRDRKMHVGMDVVGRLKPGITLAQARADLDQVARNLADAYPEADRDKGIALVPLKQDIVGDIQPFLFLLLGAVAFVLLIACANVANLLMVRASGRIREFAVRTALGATRARLVSQLLTESILLALTGGALGLLVAQWGTQAALGFVPETLPRAEEIGLDAHVLIFTLAVSLLAGILFGLAPSFKASKSGECETLKEGGRGSSGSSHRAQGVFVVVEMALAVVLLIGAGLMVRSLAWLWRVDPGFNPHNVLTFRLSLPAAMTKNPQALLAYFRELPEKLDAIPGVEASSAFAGDLPMSGDFGALPFWLEGQPKPPSDNDMNLTLWYSVEPEYFKAMQIPLLRGKVLSLEDNEHSQFVVVVDDAFARQYFGDADPIGKRINLTFGFPQAEIVGVVGHVKHWGLDSDSTAPIRAQLYFPVGPVLIPHVGQAITVVMRTHGTPLALMGSIRHTIEHMNSEQVAYDEQTMDQAVSNSLGPRRFSMILLGIFAFLALVLSSVGIYGVVAYLVGQRTHEIGTRMALGAQSQDILRLVLSEGAKMTLLGVVAGLVAALALSRLMSKMLYGVSSRDPLTFAGIAIVLALVALAACYVPARRATHVDPMTSLRHE